MTTTINPHKGYLPEGVTLSTGVSIHSIDSLTSTLPKVKDLTIRVDFFVFKAFAYIADLFTYHFRVRAASKEISRIYTAFESSNFFQQEQQAAREEINTLALKIAQNSNKLDEVENNIITALSNKELISKAGNNIQIFQQNLALVLTPLVVNAYLHKESVKNELKAALVEGTIDAFIAPFKTLIGSDSLINAHLSSSEYTQHLRDKTVLPQAIQTQLSEVSEKKKETATKRLETKNYIDILVNTLTNNRTKLNSLKDKIKEDEKLANDYATQFGDQTDSQEELREKVNKHALKVTTNERIVADLEQENIQIDKEIIAHKEQLEKNELELQENQTQIDQLMGNATHERTKRVASHHLRVIKERRKKYETVS